MLHLKRFSANTGSGLLGRFSALSKVGTDRCWCFSGHIMMSECHVATVVVLSHMSVSSSQHWRAAKGSHRRCLSVYVCAGYMLIRT